MFRSTFNAYYLATQRVQSNWSWRIFNEGYNLNVGGSCIPILRLLMAACVDDNLVVVYQLCRGCYYEQIRSVRCVWICSNWELLLASRKSHAIKLRHGQFQYLCIWNACTRCVQLALQLAHTHSKAESTRRNRRSYPYNYRSLDRNNVIRLCYQIVIRKT